MIQITPHMRIYAALEAIDFRKGIDGLAAVADNNFKEIPFQEVYFYFAIGRRTL